MKSVTFNNFFPKYLLNPLSSDISQLARAICLIASAVLAVLTLGLLHLGVAISQWNLTKVEHGPSDLENSNRNLRISHRTSNDVKSSLSNTRLPRAIANAKNTTTPKIRINHMRTAFNAGYFNRDLEDSSEGTMLHYIAKIGKDSFVKDFHERGFNFNHQDMWGNTPLLWAIANAKNTTALKILDYDQNLNLKGCGNTALHLAIAKGYKKISRDGKKLHISNLQIVQKIIEKGAETIKKGGNVDLFNVDVFNRNGCTPLHIACIRRDPEMIDTLLRAKANPTIRTKSNESNISDKDCRALIEMSYQEAQSAIDEITRMNLLPEEEFEKNKEACLKLIGSH